MSKAQNGLAILNTHLRSPEIVTSIKYAVPETLRKRLSPERVTRMVISCASRNPRLLQCTPVSIARSVVDALRLGLEPGSPLGHAYLVPFKDECTFMPGYRGYIELARRSGEIKSVTANLVHANDRFECDLASGERPVHKMGAADLANDRGEIVGAYCIAEFRDNGYHLEVMSRTQIDAVRATSKARNAGPWVDHYGEMARKTVVRRAAKYWPLSVEFAEALDRDNAIDTGQVYTSPDALVVSDSGEAEPELSASERMLAEMRDGPNAANGGDKYQTPQAPAQ